MPSHKVNMNIGNLTENRNTQPEVVAVQDTNKLIDGHLSLIFEVVNYVVICSIISLFGMVANIINITIFLKQGLDNTINISLFALALSDFCSLLCVMWLSVLANPLFYNSGIPFHTREMLYMTAGWPQKCFARVTSYIAVYITAERLLCILIPLKVKQIVTPRKTTIIISIIYVFLFSPMIPEYAVIYLDWKFYPDKNRTLIGINFRASRAEIGPMLFLVQGVLCAISFPTLIFLTSMLVWKLKQNRKWRQTVTADVTKAEIAMKRERRTITMITLISLIMIICYTPGAVLYSLNFFIPEINITGKYSNTFMVTWSFAFISEATNSSVNIFLYYRMSSRYRNTFREIFSKCFRNETKGRENYGDNYGL